MRDFPLGKVFIPAYFFNYFEFSFTNPQIIHFSAIDFVQDVNIVVFATIMSKNALKSWGV